MSAPLHRPLLDHSWREARALVATGAPVYLSVDPVEYHGPHLSLHNDLLISQGLAGAMHARLQRRWPDRPFLWGGALELGVDPTPGPGTVATPFPAARRAVLRACDALADLGARRVVLMSFHGAPMHSLAIEAGLDRLARRGVAAFAPMALMLRELPHPDPEVVERVLAPVADPADRGWLRPRLPTDFHAGFFETSLTLHFAPGSVGDLDLPPCPDPPHHPALLAAARAADAVGAASLAAELRFAAVGLGWSGLRPFPGYTARPDLANAESGAVIAGFIADRLAEVAAAIFDGDDDAPRAPMRWVRWLTLGGRLPPAELAPGEVWGVER